jgi:hypothetical protein
MKIKNLFSFIIVGVIALLSLGANVKAADTNNVSLSCTKTSINIGESTVCTVYGTAYFTSSTDAPSAVTVTINPSEYLNISAVTASTTNGFTKTNEAKSDSGVTYSFSNSSASTKITSGTKFEIMSFTATLSQEAKNLSNTDNCAEICISAATFNSSSLTSGNYGTCYNPSVTVTDCTGSNCNANTGAFLNYALIGTGAAVAVVAIIVARKNNKFYRI